MDTEKIIKRIFSEFCAELRGNEGFRIRIEAALAGRLPAKPATPQRKGGRRSPAVLNPLALLQEGEARLRERLTPLALDQLKDIIAEYGMDPSKKFMKIKTPATLVERILEVTTARNEKGNAFR